MIKENLALHRKVREGTGSLMLLLAAIIWGGGFVAGKMALTTLTPFAILTWRFGLAAILSGLLFSRRILHTPRKTILYGCVIGCLQMCALGLQLTGLQYTTSAKQSFLCTAYVAFTPFVSWILLRSRLQLHAILAGLMSLCGIGLICLNGALLLNPGDLLSLAFSVLFSVQITLTGYFVSADTDAIQLSFFQFLSAAGIAWLVSLIRGESFFAFGTESGIGVCYLAVLNTLAAFLLQNIAQKSVKDTTASLIISMESIFGFLFSVLYYHEALTYRFLLGGALCFAAILLNSSRSKQTAL